MATKFLDYTGLSYLWNKIKTYAGNFACTAAKALGIHFVIPNETEQTATLTATITGVTSYFVGLTVALRMPFNTPASATLNINNLGAKPIYYKVNTTSANYYPANTVVLLVYETTTLNTGCFKMVYAYDSNTNNATAQNISTSNATYPVLIGATANATANIGNKATYFCKDVKINPSTGILSANGFIGDVTGDVTGNASTASAVAWSGVTSKPTTIAGYGITDANIANGTITLGSNSITPLTSVPNHNQASNTINAMTGYSKPNSTSAITTSDTLNQAIGKLEKAIDDADITNTVHLTGNEFIGGIKEFGNSYYDSTRESETNWESSSLIIRYQNYIKGSGNPIANKYANLLFLDKIGTNINWSGRLGAVENDVLPSGAHRMRLVCYKNEIVNDVDTRDMANFIVGYDDNGVKFALCPSTSENRDNETDIVTRDWIPKDTRVVHTTGNETVSGYKTFTNTITTNGHVALKHNDTELGVNPSESKYRDYRFLDKNGDYLGYIEYAAYATGGARLHTLVKAIGDSTKWAEYNIYASVSDSTPGNFEVKISGIKRNSTITTAQAFWPLKVKDGNDSTFGGIYCSYGTDKATSTRLMAYKGTTTSDSDWNSISVGYDSSGNVYTYAPTPATSDNSTKIATTGFVKAQGYLTSHQSLDSCVKTTGNQTIAGYKTFTNNMNVAGIHGLSGNDGFLIYADNDYNNYGGSKIILRGSNNSDPGIITFDTHAANNASSCDMQLKSNFGLEVQKALAADYLYLEQVNPYVYFIETDTTKGSSNSSYQGLYFCDNKQTVGSGVDGKNNLGAIIVNCGSNTSNYLCLDVYQPVANSTTYRRVALAYNGGSTDSNIYFYPSNTDNVIRLGSGAHRWGPISSGTSTIATSDARFKSEIMPVPDNMLDAWENLNWYLFKMNDSIAEKGDKARIHSGTIAQEVARIFEEHNLDPNRYGMYCYDEWDAKEEVRDENGKIREEAEEAGNRYSLRYEEVLCIEAAYQRRKNKILENRISELERQVSDMLVLLQNLTNGNG